MFRIIDWSVADDEIFQQLLNIEFSLDTLKVIIPVLIHYKYVECNIESKYMWLEHENEPVGLHVI